MGQQEAAEEEEGEVAEPTTTYKLDWTVYDGSGRYLPMRNEYMRFLRSGMDWEVAWRVD